VKSIDLLIECKEDPVDEWSSEVLRQIRGYLQNFRPKTFVLASLEPVPSWIKSNLERMGVKCIDSLRPGENPL